ncbi:hypothetical protein KRR55_08320 [Paeniglutamicibacter sp. ABSL32-1]|uniref:hypothetical protein n=1 Tax=Paeniglutamicibacter quisquiliarum TaxID=2849498 RepID=UPI001C2DC9AA|nr:hypothetical protein [Paeniglutamicibacter quisquiliarum]MBV1779115.1 hypothetical protein [Paeniglutamicibacter quisquiliarum]
MEPLGSNQAPAQGKKITINASTLSLAVMVTVFLVAVVFAANQNDVIGWLVVVISLGWLLLSAFLVFGLRRGAAKMTSQLKAATAAAATRGQGAPSAGTVVMDEATRNRDLKLDHSFKIIQVQTQVVNEYRVQDGEEAAGMVDRALETIEITASNARDMMKPSGRGEPMTGEVID